MKIQVFYSKKDDMERFGNEIQFWSNGIGELHHRGVSISEEELPPELQRAYEDLWTDRYSGLCYLVETTQGYGVALLYEYDDCYADDCSLTMDQLFQFVLEDGEVISQRAEFQHNDIYIGEFSGFCECHELIVVFPAATPVNEFSMAAALLDELVYQSAKQIKPSLSQTIYSADQKANNQAIDQQPLFLFQENRSGNRMGKPGDLNNIYNASWFEFYTYGSDSKPHSEGCSINFKDPSTNKLVSGGNGISEVDVIESFREANCGRSIVLLSINSFKGTLESKMNQALMKFREDGQALLVFPPIETSTKQADRNH